MSIKIKFLLKKDKQWWRIWTIIKYRSEIESKLSIKEICRLTKEIKEHYHKSSPGQHLPAKKIFVRKGRNRLFKFLKKA